MKIIPFNPDYLKEILDIEKRLFSVPWTRFDFEMLISDFSINFILWDEEKNRIAGYLFSIIDGPNLVHLLNLAIDTPYQNQGWATRFLYVFLYTILLPANMTDIILEVRESNKKAISLYKKIGFVHKDTYKNYYQKPVEDALVMYLKLKKSPE